jgi:hypothetical protein
VFLAFLPFMLVFSLVFTGIYMVGASQLQVSRNRCSPLQQQDMLI